MRKKKNCRTNLKMIASKIIEFQKSIKNEEDESSERSFEYTESYSSSG